MYPVLFKIGPVSFYSYGMMVAVGFLICTWLSSLHAKKEGVPVQFIVDLLLYILIFGIMGARALFVILNIGHFLKYPLEIFMLTRGGLAIFGGIIAAVATTILYSRKKGFSPLEIADIIIPYAALGQAIGRIGCFLNGCCWGKPTESVLGTMFPGHVQPLHPAQIYSFFALLVIFITLKFLQKRKTYNGQIFKFYILFYCMSRFFIELLRNDSPRIIADLTIFQIFCIVLFAAALIFVRKRERT